MENAALAVAFFALCTSVAAVQLFFSRDNLGTTTSAQAAQDLLPLAAMGGLLAGVASIYHQLHHAAGARTELAAGMVSAVVGLLQFLVFVGVDDGAQARELGMAAAHFLPAAASAVFFLVVALVFAHVRAGGGAVAGDGPAHMPVWGVLTKIALGSTAALIGLIVLAL